MHDQHKTNNIISTLNDNTTDALTFSIVW